MGLRSTAYWSQGVLSSAVQGKYTQPSIIAGNITRVNRTWIWRGSMRVARYMPIDAASTAPASRTRTSSGQSATSTAGAWPWACTSRTTGKTSRPATRPSTAAERIFWRPSTRTDTGASARSSMAPGPDNSITRGNVTAAIACRTMEEPTSPGTMTVENASPPGPAPPAPTFGSTYAKTKTNSSGWTTIRTALITKLRRSTLASRAIMAAKVCRARLVAAGARVGTVVVIRGTPVR